MSHFNIGFGHTCIPTTPVTTFKSPPLGAKESGTDGFTVLAIGAWLAHAHWLQHYIVQSGQWKDELFTSVLPQEHSKHLLFTYLYVI